MADDNQVIEERVEFMVPPSGGHVCLRKAYFLKPSVASINGPVEAPSINSSANCFGEYKDLPLKVQYRGWWKRSQKTWKTWVDQMHPLHNSTWKKSGILEAIMSSTFHIHRYDELILGMVEKWCPTTNSFVFPWGEATVTLEDMAVLGGYSVLGESVFSPIGDAAGDQVMKKLLKSRSKIIRSKSRNAYQGKWVSEFMGSGSEIEHEAFLAYWLCRFVFPFWKDTIRRSVLPIAVHLARGTRIALAPAALAPIYKTLTHLKASVIAAKRSGGENDVVEVTVSAQLALIQVWIWERFPSLRPNPRSIGENEPRLGRWHDLKLEYEFRSLTLDSAGNDFVWRPYTGRKRNGENGSGRDSDELVRWLRASELVSLEENCIEQYLPHRVAMQFGLDQDLPGHVARLNVNSEIAFRDYNRAMKLDIPPLVSAACVTSRYAKWWKKLNHGWSQDSKGSFIMKVEDDYLAPPPGFCPKRMRVEETQRPPDNNSPQGIWRSSKESGEVIESSDCNESVAEHSQVKPSSSDSSSRIEKHVSVSGNDNHLLSNAANVGEEMLVVESKGVEIEDKLMIIEKLFSLIKAGKLDVKMTERK